MMMMSLMRLAAREIYRDMTLAPPRHGKSHLRAIYFAAWYILNNPHHYVVIACNSSDLAKKFSRSIKQIVDLVGSTYGVRVSKDKRSVVEWETNKGGGVFAVGVGGQLVGRSANLLIMDDTIKLPVQALSPKFRQEQWDWYVTVADTRLEPEAIVCFTMTPWHEDDLAGRLQTEDDDDWFVQKFRAICEEGDDDPIGRKPGEALWPERYPVERILRKQKQDPFWFDALYQLRPRARGGQMFKVDWFTGDHSVDTLGPRGARRLRFWDKASTKNGGDWTAGVRMAFWDRTCWIEDVKRFRLGSTDRDKQIREVCIADNQQFDITTWGEQEPGGSGKDCGEGFIRLLAGYKVKVHKSSGDKVTRAEPFANFAAGGNVYVRKAPWNKAYVGELTSFPSGKNDDQVDATSGGFNRVYLDKRAPGGYASNGRILVPRKYVNHGGGYVT